MDDLIRRSDAERALTILGAQLSEKHTRTVAKCVCAIKDVPAVGVNDIKVSDVIASLKDQAQDKRTMIDPDEGEESIFAQDAKALMEAVKMLEFMSKRD